MYLDTFCPCYEPEYVITKDWIAASGHPVVDAADILCIYDENDIIALTLCNPRLDCLLFLLRRSTLLNF